jgi:hypothetical protein
LPQEEEKVEAAMSEAGLLKNSSPLAQQIHSNAPREFND